MTSNSDQASDVESGLGDSVAEMPAAAGASEQGTGPEQLGASGTPVAAEDGLEPAETADSPAVPSPPDPDSPTDSDDVEQSGDGPGDGPARSSSNSTSGAAAAISPHWVKAKEDGWSWVRVDNGLYSGRIAATKLTTQEGFPNLEGQDRVRPQLDGARQLAKRSADIEMDFGYAGDSQVFLSAASVRGSSHYSGKPLPCQDRYHFRLVGRFLLIAVADGVSAAPASHHGAQIACRVALENLEAQLRSVGEQDWRPAIEWTDVADTCRRRLLEIFVVRAREKDPEVLNGTEREIVEGAVSLLATTLDVAVVDTEPNSSGNTEFAVASIAGDGSALVADAERGWNILYRGKEPAEDSLASNAVNPLPRAGTLHSLVFGSLEPGQSLTVMTDGVGDLVGGGTLPAARVFLDQISRGPTDIVPYLDLVGMLNANGTDDRTAVTIWCGSTI